MPQRLLIGLTLIFLQYSFAFSQETSVDQSINKLHNYSQRRPEEKVYLHFDKEYYVAGETLWFKSYITLGGAHFPSPQAGLLYVDFYDQQDIFIEQIAIPCTNGFGSGYFDIPEHLKDKELRVRAYTNWMRNFNKDYIFQKNFLLITNEPTPKVPVKASLDFYPEGGQIIEGLKNSVAIKTNIILGDEAFLLIDSEGNELDEVEVDQRGYGQFTFKPVAGERYFMTFNGQQFELPAPVYNGISMILNSYANPRSARLTLRKKSNTTPNKVFVMVHTRGTVHYSTELDFNRAATIVNIPKDILPAGVNHLTVFDENQKPLAERLFYIDRPDLVKLNAQTAETTSTRKKVVIDLDLSGVTGQQVLESSLSLSAIQRSNIEQSEDSENIKTYLLLNSDLRGQIKDPGYYFTDQSIEKKQALDLVMMTHGWRRFAWEKILNAPLDSVKYEPQNGVTIRGRMVKKGSNNPVVNGSITYMNNQNNQLVMRNETTNESGEFVLTDLLHTSEDKVVLKGLTSTKGLKRQSKQVVDFQIDSLINILNNKWWLTSPDNSETSVNAQIIADTEKRQLYDSLYNFDPDVRIIEGVTVEDNRLEDPTEVSPIYGRGTVTFEVPEEPRTAAFRDIFSLMAGQVAGINITPAFNPANTVVQIRGAVRIGGATQTLEPKYVLNDMPSDLQTIVYLPIEDIDRVEIFKGPDALAHGLNTIGGVIAVYTKTKLNRNYRSNKEQGLQTLSLPGIQVPQEFFSPDYATRIPEHAKPDTRSLVHWQPFIETDKTGKASVTFWTSDNTGFIDINIQGITYGGEPLVKKLSIKVDKAQ